MWNDPEGAYDLALFQQRDLHKAGSNGRLGAKETPRWRLPAARLLRALADALDPGAAGLEGAPTRPAEAR